MAKNGLSKKELKELRAEAYDRLHLYHAMDDYDECLQTLCVNGYVELMGIYYINEKIFIDECTKILEKLMENLSTKEIDRKYMRTYTINISDMDSSETFTSIMNGWTYNNPYLNKISKVRAYIIDEFNHIITTHMGRGTSTTKEINELASKCFIDIYSIRKSADEIFTKEGTATYADGLLYLVKFCLDSLIDYREEDRGCNVDTDKWDESEAYLKHLELLLESLIANTKIRKDAIKALIDSVDDIEYDYIVDMIFKDVEGEKNP